MRRLLLLLMLVPALASATQIRCLVVERPVAGWVNSGAERDATVSAKFQRGRMHQLLKTLGVDYVSVSSVGTKTEWARTGAQVWRSGTSGAAVENFGAVIHLGTKNTSTGVSGAYRPDSILKINRNSGTYFPTVPQLYAYDDYDLLTASGAPFVTQACCSTGASALVDGGGGAIYDLVHDRRWENQTYASSAITNQTPAGGLRKLLGQHGEARILNWAGGDGGGCDHCDSLTAEAARATNDTMNVWERPFTGITGAKSAVFLYADGNGGPASGVDTLYDFNPADQAVDWRQPAEGEISMMMVALARMDSLCGNQLFDWNRLPLVRAVTVSNLCSRGARLGHHGIHPSDTTTFYTSIDSLAVMRERLPIVFGVNADPDSMRVYLRDLIKAATIPGARFTPELRTGLDSTAAMNGGATKYHRPRDVWGRYRSRAAYGDGTCTGADTSLYCMLRGAREVLDSVLTSIGAGGRMEPFALAADDDWSPKNSGRFGGPSVDSLLYVLARAGYVGVVSDGREEHANTGTGHPNPLGWDNRQGYRTERIGNNTLKILRHSGYPIIGSQSWLAYFDYDYAAPADSGVGASIHYQELNRAWGSFTQDHDFLDTDVFNMYYNDHLAGLGSDLTKTIDRTEHRMDHRYPGAGASRGYVLRYCANDLSGATTSPYPDGWPPRNAYWTIRSLNSAFASINAFAGKTVMRFGYPSEVKP